ncbi:ABC transporter substrate-binding protein [Brachybacterium endophyticum]|uniref:ABC transporter substrate-binding protein n=1 Tax=Brachybacterium endophyticum TaxID=2182385 RepID=A0A2U2RMP6_9MICO|nr:extracellular solute-binding protein [Brachybacterium endophyticum]PWH07150.1 ABC transporter substrate-binding protein [Brachybacterium endophyticum]
MLQRRQLLQGAAFAAVGGLGAAGCAGAGPSGPHAVRYWGMGAADTDKDEAARDAFLQTAAGRDAQVSIDQVPSSGSADMSQIITAVRGGTAPDVWWMDRFNAVQNASIGLLEPVDPLIEEFEGVSREEFTQQWLQFSLDELTYDGQLYGLPTSTDARGLLYNENVLKDAGVDLDLFDPGQHVITWDELREVARTVVHQDSRGNYDRLGFAPWADQGMPYTWAFGLGAEVYDNDATRVVLDSPQWQSVYNLYADWAEEFSYSKVDAFFATYQPPNAPPTQNAVFSEKLAITTGGPWQISGNKKYAPKLPLKWTWLPVAKDGDPTYTWSGGFSLVLPKGSNLSRTTWEFMKHFTGFAGQSIVVPKLGSLPTNLEAITAQKYDPDAELFRQMLPNSTSRPPLPVGSAVSDAMDRAKTSVALGTKSPREVAEETQAMVVPKMDLFPGYRIPESYGKPQKIPDSR